MLRDATELEDGASLEADVCIVGSGPAGLTAAQDLRGMGLRTCVLEGGGLGREEAAQSLAEGDVTGEPVTPLRDIIRRQLGGTANAWDIQYDVGRTGVRYVPLDPIDFAERPWVPYSGWPFDRAALDPFYERAQVVCGLDPLSYDVADWATPARPALPLDPDRVKSAMFHIGPASAFLAGARERIERAEDVTLWLHANAIELETDDDGARVTGVRVACLAAW